MDKDIASVFDRAWCWLIWLTNNETIMWDVAEDIKTTLKDQTEVPEWEVRYAPGHEKLLHQHALRFAYLKPETLEDWSTFEVLEYVTGSDESDYPPYCQPTITNDLESYAYPTVGE